MSTIVVSSGITVSGLVISNGTELFVDGAVINTVVAAGGYADIFGTASGTVIESGGEEDNYGTTTGTVVEAGGIEDVDAGTASGSMISGGSEFVFSGASAVGTNVASGGVQGIIGGYASAVAIADGGVTFINSGAVATDVAVLSGGQFLNSGSQLSDATISAGGTLALLNSAALTRDTEIQSGGELIVVPGTDLTGITVDSGAIVLAADVMLTSGYGLVSAWAGATPVGGLVVSPGESLQVYAGGTVQAVLMTGGLFVLSGGTANGTTIEAASGVYAEIVVSHGAADLGAMIGASGIETVESGGLASGAIVFSGGQQYTEGGTVIGTQLENDGALFGDGGLVVDAVIGAGGVAELRFTEMTGALIQSGGIAYVTAGAISDTTVQSGGTLTLAGASAQGTVLSGGAETLLSGGTESGVRVGSGSLLTIFDGQVNGATVASGGTIMVDDGQSGVAQDVVSAALSVGGVLDFAYISYDQAASTSFDTGTDQLTITDSGATTVLQLAGNYSGESFRLFADEHGDLALTVTDGRDVVGSGVTSSGLVVSYPENLVVDGGTVLSTTVSSGGAVTVQNGGLAVGTLVGSVGSDIASAGGVLSQSVIGAGGHETVSAGGIARGTTVGSAAQQEVLAGGEAFETLVGSSGVVSVASGGVLSFGFLGNGGSAYVTGGTVDGLTIGSGGSAYLQGTASGVAVQGGGILDMIGTASATIVSGGTEDLYNATDTGALLEAGGIQQVRGSAISTMISSGGTQVVMGTAIDTLVASGGTQSGDGGNISSTLIEAGGLGIYSGGFAPIQGLFVQSGGLAILEQYASLIDGTVASGGTLILLPGAQFSSSTIASGALVVSAGAVAVQGTGRAQAGALVSGLTLEDGIAYALAGGTLENLAASGSDLVILSGGLATGLSFVDGTETVSSGGIDRGAVIGSGGGQYLLSGAVASGATILAGGVQSDAYQGFSGPATMTDTVVMSGGQQMVEGFALDTVVSVGGAQTVYGSSIGTVLRGGSEYADGRGMFERVASVSGTQVYSGGLLNVGNYASAANTVLNFGGVLTDAGGATGTVINAGGSMQLLDAVYFGLLDMTAPGAASGTVINSGGTLVVGTGNPSTEYPYTLYAQVIGTTLEQGGVINLKDVGFDSSLVANFDAGTDRLTISDAPDGVDDVLGLEGDYTGDYFHLTEAMDGSVLVTMDGTPCYCRGTLIATNRGDIPVENLSIGDCLITLSGAVRRIRWIGRRGYDGRFAAGNSDVLPITFKAGCLGDGLPRRDLSVSPQHAMFLDGVLIPAWCLVDGVRVTRAASVERVEYFHLELESHDIIFAEGAASESFLEDGNRLMFQNGADYAPLAVPGAKCAPLVQDGRLLEAVRRRIAGTAPAQHGALRGWLDLVQPGRVAGWALDDAGPVRLRLLADGVAIAEMVAALKRPDVAVLHGQEPCGFEHVIEGGLPPGSRHVIRVERAEDGAELPNSPWVLEASRAAAANALPSPEGRIDRLDRMRVRGWAWAADGPVDLQVLVDGALAGEVLANAYRADLAGRGNGRHGFDFHLPGALAVDRPHMVEVRRARDGAHLPGSPVVLEASHRFDDGLRETLTQAVAGAVPSERAAMLRFLQDQSECLRATDAEHQTGDRRVLVIAQYLPDAALLARLAATQAEGWDVSYAAAAQLDRHSPALAGLGITLCGTPVYGSVEDVLRRQGGRFTRVELHGPVTAALYAALARHWMPKAEIVSLERRAA